MKEKFTQGEWAAEFNGYYWEVCVGAHRFIICTENDYAEEPVTLEKAEANAHLIAASPKLYRRLQYLTDMMREEYPAIAERNDKLLAEARGEK